MSDEETFHIEMDSRADQTLIVRLDGELDMSDADWVESTLATAAEHHRHIDIDLSQVKFIDSTGIRALMALKQRAAILRIEAHFIEQSAAVRRAIAAADLGTALE